MGKNNKLHIIMLFICAFFWGTTFAAQSIGAGFVGPFTYLAGRSWIAVAGLTPVIYVLDRIADSKGRDNRRPRNAYQRRYLVFTGLICGTVLCLASASQQAGIAWTTAGKASFLTALYVVLVPVAAGIILKKKPPLHIWVCVLICLIGMLLLCLGRSLMAGSALSVEKGDALVILCAVLFTVQVLCVYRFGPMLNGVYLSRMQFLVVAVESTVIMFAFEHPQLSDFVQAIPAILYAGVFSSGVAYTLQIIGQEDVNPAIASMIMSLESVFGALAGWLILGERMLPVEMAGAVLMFAAVMLSQIPLPAGKHPEKQ